ncbi:MAG TPA: di-trans,poly-cis-decaprenylcistransferase [Candidatus Wildermuthbacteria bacterium]|uniref:Isoprenyl transferase n=1 Tax=Candidatus Yanofskybacteria bacterium GW2011_GWC1_48_11 TaxID=1619027 RepID=A0A837ISI9_9BACT|nr:MAG: Undecaprenyl diphosphate synthase [Candidatus Yanofskybacteria bacterium GW2011_GWC1_48_11]KKW04703.1 MAG: Isoprenyl transferase [Parcubacteria group bacterium GW2011_GWB1_49_12]KKW08998.1 MAG: Isoprenyl transferase [Parcubacteria group bacterium GW2011_GWA1_49_26]KKW14233.1 MAG: Isoprenyl transferase [Parcubacteria group bacterium GW2011_GWA2_50_10]OHA61051.1 MAG: di-trans,poly-cis-decaprenylcistransferase [Candidatus Wildermuthbacteria bacterium GWA1_49_26]OHA66028.1 MAG: di-trans,po
MRQQNSAPKHVVILPDGNRRWARERGLDTVEGHKAGYKKLIDLCRWARDRGVKAVTAFGFSTENWNRPKREIQYLMNLLETGLRENFSEESKKAKAKELGIRVRIIGQKGRLPQSLQKIIGEVEEYTKVNTKLYLNLAISYGGRWDIVQAAKKIIGEGIRPEELTEELFNEHLTTGDLPDPDLFIRTGGEQRLSNLVIWQAAYTELYFCPKYWPDFSEEDFDNALAEYARRQRRFGR